jgi:DNA-binding transcriptional LysR family regulator
MLFRQLEYFVTLSRVRHFARAAAECSVTQPALSDAIRKLERELDMPLVQRANAFEGLTPEGERLVIWTERILADRDSMQQAASALRTGLTGELHLGLIPAAVTTVARIIDSFAAIHPLVAVHLHGDLASSEIVRRLHHFEIDAGLIYVDENGASDQLDVLPLYEELHVLLVPSRLLPDPDVHEMTWAAAAQLPLCLLDTTMRGRRIVDKVFAEIGTTASPAVQTDSIAALCAHVATGRWASIVPHTWSPDPAEQVGARVLQLTDPTVRSQVWLATTQRADRSLVARAFANVALSLAPEGFFRSAVIAEEESSPTDLPIR